MKCWVNAETHLLCVLGNPIRHSLSPTIHNAAIQALGLNYIYVAIDVPEVAPAISALRVIGCKGFNVTAPFKIDALRAVDVVDPLAQKAGSMNTGYWLHEQLHGTNTDVMAVQEGLKRHHRQADDLDILVFGAGGAARAVLAACPEARIRVVNRGDARAAGLLKDFPTYHLTIHEPRELAQLVQDSHVLVNATPIGRSPGETPFPAALLQPGHTVIDLVYHEEPTLLVQDARLRGAKVVDGKEFLILQGMASFALWTGQRPSRDAMMAALTEELR